MKDADIAHDTNETAATTAGRAIADDRAAREPERVYGAWLGSVEEMRAVVNHVDAAQRESLARAAHQAACRRWAELVLARGALGRRGVAVGMLTAGGVFAWPGDHLEWVDPITGAPDSSPWLVRESWDGGCLLVRRFDVGRLFVEPHMRRVVSEVRMRRLRMWLPS